MGLPERRWQALRGAGIGMVFQEPAAALDPVRTIGAEIEESIRLHSRVTRARARELARAALAEVAFPDPDGGLDEYPHRLSGGLRQRAHLASVLAAESHPARRRAPRPRSTPLSPAISWSCSTVFAASAASRCF